MLCVSSVSFSFLLNGIVFSSLKIEKRLRQGDPLFPYLFLLCAEAFSGLLQQEERAGNILGVSICRDGLAVSHILFADETLIFYQATKDVVLRIKAVLHILEVTWGFKMNLEKSVVVFSKNTPLHVRAELALILSVLVVAKHDKYLGLPPSLGSPSRWCLIVSETEFGGRCNAGPPRSCHKFVAWLLSN
ncbi:UNVERIFIED_CONTAM: putative mitochondrial protein [Sesamum radiatum]|uniref:Mitochondrial protein n=1 Tax=Sesamum radiatum TaxID=300843 RepID=A0AAW2TJM0_SESRA